MASFRIPRRPAAPKACRLRLLKGKNEGQSTGWTVALNSRPTQVSEFGQEERSLALSGSAAVSRPDPNLAARPNPLCIKPLLFLIREVAPW